MNIQYINAITVKKFNDQEISVSVISRTQSLATGIVVDGKADNVVLMFSLSLSSNVSLLECADTRNDINPQYKINDNILTSLFSKRIISLSIAS